MNIKLHPLLVDAGIKVGSELDLDYVIRSLGFDSGDEIAEITHEGFVFSVVILGEHEVRDNLTDVSYDFEFIKENKDDLEILEGCWISVDMVTPTLDYRISDEYVTDSIQSVIEFIQENLYRLDVA